MDIVSDPAFWANTGLVAASRLAVLATALWIARLAVRGWTPQRATKPKTMHVPETPRRAVPAPATMKRAPEQPATEPRYVDLSTTRAKRPVASATENTVRREQLQNRLMEYLDQRASERTHS